MSEILTPDGRQISIAGVNISAIGLGGKVDVHFPTGVGMRTAEDARPRLIESLAEADFIEQLTIEITEPREYLEFVAATPDGRGGEITGPEIELTVPAAGEDFGQVLLACDEDGVLSWHYPVDVAPAEILVRSPEHNTYRLPATVVEAPSPGARGLLGAIGKKLLKVLIFQVADKVLGIAGNYWVSRYERSKATHRLRLFKPDDYRQGGAPDLSTDGLRALTAGPALLFLHGTASRSHKAFATLPQPFLARLNERYGGRVFAFDHPTLSVPPDENVRWLAAVLDTLPPDASFELDIVAHSRGGLVGRVISERPETAGLDRARLRVRRLVMVATPNAGTALADRKHLDEFIDTMTNLLEFIPDNPATDTIDVILELVKQVAIGVMGGLEGLMSMDPDGAFLQGFLNRPASVDAAYNAVSSNYEPDPNEPLGRFARDHLTDLVFEGRANDLVVPTAGVFEENGGSSFPVVARLELDSGKAVDHSGFWTQPSVLDSFNQWLGMPESVAIP